MTGDMIVVVLLAAPAILFAVLYFLLGRRVWTAGVVTALVGAACAAFLVSAGSAMSTAVDPNEALLRGAAMGFAGSAVAAAVVAGLFRVLRL